MKWLGKIFGRVILVSVAIALQLAFLFVFIFQLSAYYLPVTLIMSAISLLASLVIINRPGNPAVKMAWIVPILVFPLFGGVVYFISGGKGPKKKLLKAMDKSEQALRSYREDGTEALQALEMQDPLRAGQFRYLYNHGFPVYQNTVATYYSDGYSTWKQMLEDLETAERFIFLEYFIISPGQMWDAILDVLARKAGDGVDVRILYDDVGSIQCLPHKYPDQLRQMGIHCVAFNRYRPVYSAVMNHRDHRKIMVIDGRVGYTGGINLADEYIGAVESCGVWKDNGLRLAGDAVRSMTRMFVHVWNAVSPHDQIEAGERLPLRASEGKVVSDGYVQPYGDSPVDNELIGGNVYLNMINQATKYVYICTPYVVLDHETERALCLATRRGVDVRLVVPGIPDKKFVYHLTKSHFPELIANGVKVYRFNEGFVHAKCFVADDAQAVVGTINLDYRSLMLHFENGVLFGHHPVVAAVKADFEDMFARCELVENRKRRFNLLYEFYLSLLRLLAPLM